MNSFAQFNIKPDISNFQGEKIKVSKILNKKIVVLDYKIETSKFEKGDGKRLVLQIQFDAEKRVVFSGSVYLKQMIQQVPRDQFPFTTTIIEENESLQFS